MSRPTRPRTPPPSLPETQSPPRGAVDGPAGSPEPSGHRPAARPAGSAQRRRAVRAAGSPTAARSTPADRPARNGSRSTTGAPPTPGTGSRARAPRSAPVVPTARTAARVADLAGARLARRGRPGRRLVVGVVVLVVLAVLAGWLLLASPWLRVVDVRVSGTERTERSAVQAIVDGERGSSLAAVNTRALAAQVAALPLVQSVDVTRAWPSTLDVVVHEREAVAAVPSTGGGFDLVDENARVLVKADAAPAGVPTLAVDVATAGVSALRAALDVNGTLPADVRSRVAQISATGPDAVTLQLADGPRVVWGSAERPERKGEVLQRMLADPDLGSATVLDVSAPDAPAVVR